MGDGTMKNGVTLEMVSYYDSTLGHWSLIASYYTSAVFLVFLLISWITKKGIAETKGYLVLSLILGYAWLYISLSAQINWLLGHVGIITMLILVVFMLRQGSVTLNRIHANRSIKVLGIFVVAFLALTVFTLILDDGASLAFNLGASAMIRNALNLLFFWILMMWAQNYYKNMMYGLTIVVIANFSILDIGGYHYLALQPLVLFVPLWGLLSLRYVGLPLAYLYYTLYYAPIFRPALQPTAYDIFLSLCCIVAICWPEPIQPIDEEHQTDMLDSKQEL